MMAGGKVTGVRLPLFIGEASDSTGSNTTQLSINLSGIDIDAGDIGILLLYNSGNDTTPGLSETMTPLYNVANTACYVMTMAGTETVLTTSTVSTGYKIGSFLVYRHLLEPASIGSATGSATAANPPSVSAENKDTVLAISVRSNIPADNEPSGYTTVSYNVGTTFGSIHAAEKSIAADGAEDPAPFSSTTGTWVAFTLLLRYRGNV